MVAFAAYYLLQGSTQSAAGGVSAPKQQLDRVRERAKEIERDSQRRADELFKKSE